MQASTYSLLFLVGLAGCTKPAAKANSAPELQAVRVVKVRTGSMVEGRGYLAEVVPSRTVKVIAQVPGTLASLPVAEGVQVKRKTLLARILAPDIAARYSRVNAERRRAERERDFACGQVKTDRVLAKSGDLTSIHLDRSEKGCASAELAVTAAQSAEAEVLVAKHRNSEVAPFDGQVLKYLVDEGQTVMPGMPLLQYGSTELLYRLRVPATELSSVKIGTRISASKVSGRVVEIGAQALGPGRLVEVLAELDSATQVQVGATFTVTLVTAEKADAHQVPETALLKDGDDTYVLTLSGDKLRRVAVTLGLRQDGWVGIEPALPSGTQVATGRLEILDLSRSVLAVSK